MIWRRATTGASTLLARAPSLLITKLMMEKTRGLVLYLAACEPSLLEEGISCTSKRHCRKPKTTMSVSTSSARASQYHEAYEEEVLRYWKNASVTIQSTCYFVLYFLHGWSAARKAGSNKKVIKIEHRHRRSAGCSSSSSSSRPSQGSQEFHHSWLILSSSSSTLKSSTPHSSRRRQRRLWLWCEVDVQLQQLYPMWMHW